jgi:hypothetical protein
MEALATIQEGMSTMQQSITSMQQEVRSINKRTEQTQLDHRECLKYHHPDSSDDEEVATRTAPMVEDDQVSFCFVLFETFCFNFCYFLLFVKLVTIYYSVSRVLLRPLGGVIFILVGVYLLCFTLCPFVTKRGSNFYFWTGNVFPNRSSDFCHRMAKGGVC